MNIKILRMTEDSLGLISTAYRLCYNSTPKDKKEEMKFIAACIKNGHESPLEHCSVTFLVDEISRTCSHQIVRHRIASYTQESQRYVSALQNGYIIPFEIAKVSKYRKAYQDFMRQSTRFYQELVAQGFKKEDARFILPQGIGTRLLVTMNMRELRHFLDLRLDRKAQWEIRGVALDVLLGILKREPNLFCVFGDIVIKYKLETKIFLDK